MERKRIKNCFNNNYLNLNKIFFYLICSHLSKHTLKMVELYLNYVNQKKMILCTISNMHIIDIKHFINFFNFFKIVRGGFFC